MKSRGKENGNDVDNRGSRRQVAQDDSRRRYRYHQKKENKEREDSNTH